MVLVGNKGDCAMFDLGAGHQSPLFVQTVPWRERWQARCRAVPCRGRGDGATLIVDQYMHELYWSAAEDLPETVRLDDVDQCIERNDLSDAQKEKLTSHQRAFIDGGAIPQWSPNERAADLLAKTSNHGEKVWPPRHIQHCHSEIFGGPSSRGFWRFQLLLLTVTQPSSRCDVRPGLLFGVFGRAAGGT